MSSSQSLRAESAPPLERTAPYADYAKLLQQLLPSTRKICFYDQSNRIRWASDGVEAPELGHHVAKLLLQVSGSNRQSSTTKTESGITHVAAIRGADDSIKGALVLALGRRKYGRRGAKVRGPDIDAALAPLLRIVGRAWDASDRIVVAPVSPSHNPAPRVQRDPFVGAAARATSAPVLLRRALSRAVDASPCAFGALIAAERQFTMVQRGTDSQVQSEMLQVVDSLRQSMAALMDRRDEVLFISGCDPSLSVSIDYELIAYPLRNRDSQLAALLILFRKSHEQNFNSADCASLQHIAARIPSHVFEALAPFAPTRIAARTILELPLTQSIVTKPAQSPIAEPSMEQRLRAALREDGFDLHAQSIAPLRDASNTARYEVLLRLRDHDSLQLPETFLEVAEAGGLLPDIDRWVVGRLLKSARPHIDALNDGRWEFALNVSAASLQRKSFGDFIETQLFRSNVPPQALVFEFSEHDVLAHRPLFEHLAPRIAALGCRVALDNCRQGLDIFLSIADLPVHRLKIDAALTHHLTSDTRAARAVRELVEVASDIGIETVGEHVEDEATREMLRELGIDFAQGFNVAHPRALTELLS